MKNGKTATLAVLPSCDFCKLENPLSDPQIARFEAPTASGWVFLCCYHYKGYALSEGTKLVAEDDLEIGAVEREIVFARQRLAEEGA